MRKTTTLLASLSLFGTTAAGKDTAATQEMDGTIHKFNIIAESYSFTPDHIVMQAGVPVVLVVEKKGIIPHDLIIDDPASGLSIKKSLSGITEIRFTPMKKGEFEFYCGKDVPFVKSHREKGMHGILEVR